MAYYSSGISPKSKSFSEAENDCKCNFEDGVKRWGPFWHIYTPGNLTEIINLSPDDFRFSVSNVAISTYESGIFVVTYAVMENHLHIIAGGLHQQCQYFLEFFVYRQRKYLKSIGRDVNLSHFVCNAPIEITNLEMMGNEIAYVNRNGYVGNPSYTPFTYPWGGGSLFFNPYAQNEKGIPFNEIKYNDKRFFSRRSVCSIPETYQVKNKMILPSGYTNYQFGESLFRDAHHYYNVVSKNFEAFSSMAKSLGDTIVLSTDEIYPAVSLICIQKYNIKQPSAISPSAKIEVARIMHSDYHATNAQIQRILNISRDLVNELFPLSSSKK